MSKCNKWTVRVDPETALNLTTSTFKGLETEVYVANSEKRDHKGRVVLHVISYSLSGQEIQTYIDEKYG